MNTEQRGSSAIAAECAALSGAAAPLVDAGRCSAATVISLWGVAHSLGTAVPALWVGRKLRPDGSGPRVARAVVFAQGRSNGQAGSV